MTAQTVDDLYDNARRLTDDVVEAMNEWEDDHPEIPWNVEYEIPATTNGWVYYGDHGSAATAAYWGDQFPNPTEIVGVTYSPTHPGDDNCDVAKVTHVADTDDKIGSRTEITRFEGESGNTPLHVRRRLFWQAVEATIEWMEDSERSEL